VQLYHAVSGRFQIATPCTPPIPSIMQVCTNLDD